MYDGLHRQQHASGSARPLAHSTSLFASLDAEFCFQLDAAAAPHNALCRKFITAEQNTLETPWADYLSIPGYVWLNPPYSDITPFVKKAAAESANQIGTVMLVPADTSVGWFKEAIQTASEVRFITAGRLAFINPVTGKPSAETTRARCSSSGDRTRVHTATSQLWTGTS
jgi:phage N-6-adenine-methyltransferase